MGWTTLVRFSTERQGFAPGQSVKTGCGGYLATSHVPAAFLMGERTRSLKLTSNLD
jgi:hypothetical protein